MTPDWIAEHLQSQLQRHKGQSLSRQLYHLLRDAVRSGQLLGGSALPSSRSLAASLRLGRNTVLEAYDQLLAEGYLEARHGAGTYVARLFPAPAMTTQAGSITLSTRGRQLSSYRPLPLGLHGAFAPGLPELKQFPHHIWQRCQQAHGKSPPLDWLHYQTGGGLPTLKETICQYLQLSRSVRCQPEQILILQGAQTGLELSARLLADAGEVAWMEEPGYSGAQAALLAADLKVTPVPVDEQGLSPALAPDSRPPRLIYITPSHQYPCGVVMSLERRLELLSLAKQHNSWIIEDDYDSEFRYTTHPLASLQGLQDDSRVIYISTFSKVMFPALRIAYLVVPGQLIDPFRAAYARLYREGNYLQQAALALFIEQGHLARHIRRMRELYQLRQQLLRETLRQALGNSLPLSKGEAGMHLVASLPTGFDEQQLVKTAAHEQLWLRPLGNHFLGQPSTTGLVLGYAGVNDLAIAPAARRLAQLLETQWNTKTNPPC